jgi:septum formation protein
MEKPADAAAARDMLGRLSGRRSCVHSGVCVLTALAPPEALRAAVAATPIAPAPGCLPAAAARAAAQRDVPAGYTATVFSESSAVHFAELPAPAIDAYVATREPYDKAGGYGIQGLASQFISGVTGDYYNVMGLPLHRLCAVLRQALVGWQQEPTGVHAAQAAAAMAPAE